jgi:hypothetical protein
MCCGADSGSGSSSSAEVVDTSGRADPDQVYVVTYFNGVTEEISGLAGAQRLLINPASRVEGAQTADDFPAGTVLGGTYAPK